MCVVCRRSERRHCGCAQRGARCDCAMIRYVNVHGFFMITPIAFNSCPVDRNQKNKDD